MRFPIQMITRMSAALLFLLALAPVHKIVIAADASAEARPPSSNSNTTPATMSPEERIAALERTVQTMQARIKELEAGEAKDPNAGGSGNIAAHPAAPADESSAAPTASADSGNLLSFFRNMTFSGFLDTYVDYNFNRPDSRTNSFRTFEVHDHSFSLNLLKMSIDHPAEPFGFHVDFNFGDTGRIVHSTEPGGTNLYQFLEQAYFSYRAPVGKGLTLDFGEFVTPIGAEVIESKDNYNYSRSFLFGYAIPFYHFGARAKYSFNDQFSIAAFVVNGWNNIVDNNNAKTFAVQAALNPTKRLSIVENYMAGPEQPDNDADWRHVWDSTISYALTDSVSVMGNYDYGMDRFLGERVRWQGVAGYARIQLSPWFAVSPRLEWYSDPHGFTTGIAQNLKEGTFTTEFRIKNSMLLRGEYRYDWSDEPAFERHDNTFGKHQQTIALGMIYIFGQE
jgi:hypothetical protein